MLLRYNSTYHTNIPGIMKTEVSLALAPATSYTKDQENVPSLFCNKTSSTTLYYHTYLALQHSRVNLRVALLSTLLSACRILVACRNERGGTSLPRFAVRVRFVCHTNVILKLFSFISCCVSIWHLSSVLAIKRDDPLRHNLQPQIISSCRGR